METSANQVGARSELAKNLYVHGKNLKTILWITLIALEIRIFRPSQATILVQFAIISWTMDVWVN